MRTVVLSLGLLAVVSEEAMAIETPTFELLGRYGDIELRQYGPVVVAETQLEGNAEDVGNRAFSLLAGYIFGKNAGERKIAMTAPVAQTEVPRGMKIAMTAPVSQSPRGEGTFVVQFTMPKELTLGSLPKPLDERVSLREIAARRMAVLRYSGTWSKANYEEHLRKLEAQMQEHGLKASGQPVWARYDPPWTLWFLRRNEVQIPVE